MMMKQEHSLEETGKTELENSKHDNLDTLDKSDTLDDSETIENSEISRTVEKDIFKSNDSENEVELKGDTPNEQIMNLVVKKDDVTWKTIILELVNSNRMDPWNINIKTLTKSYITTIKQLKEHDFRVSGNMILAAALLLKIKSSRLLSGDLNALDQMLASTQFEEEQDYDTMDMTDEELPKEISDLKGHQLIPRTPQARKRKVSIYDLVDALEKALEVKERRIMKKMPSLDLELPTRKLPDVSILMEHLYEKIEHMFSTKDGEVYFHDLSPSSDWEDKVVTFIPLLHLDNMSKVILNQDKHFGDIHVAPFTNSNQEIVDELVTELEN